MPDGSLTAAQLEILAAVWKHGAGGATVAEIWSAIKAERDVGRTTILNLVDRLERRGWLRRVAEDGPNRFVATRTREQTEADLATEFVDLFFQGSPTSLLKSLFGNSKLDAEEIARLKEYLRQAQRGSREGRS